MSDLYDTYHSDLHRGIQPTAPLDREAIKKIMRHLAKNYPKRYKGKQGVQQLAADARAYYARLMADYNRDIDEGKIILWGTGRKQPRQGRKKIVLRF